MSSDSRLLPQTCQVDDGAVWGIGVGLDLVEGKFLLFSLNGVENTES